MESGAAFVNRTEERRSIEALLGGKEAGLGLLYGRRRLGKTELLRQMAKGAGGIFITIPEQTRAGILLHLSEETSRQTGRPLSYGSFRDFLLDLPNHGARLVVLDEFQRLKAADKSTDSTLQEIWDARLQHSGIVLVLCGSVIGMMRKLAGRTAPLYGRFAWSLHLEPFTYSAVRLFYPEAEEAERVERFGVFGATPHYHRLSAATPMPEAIRRAFFDIAAPLREEPRLLLEMELRKPDRYQEILEALGRGARTLGEVAGTYGEKPSDYTPYVKTLREELGLIRSEDPLYGKQRKGRLYFRDPFFHFYYRFVYPNLGRLELGEGDAVMRDVARDLDAYLGKAFEEVARETLRAVNGTTYGGVAFDLRELGGWWEDGEELDAVGVGPECAYACEAKFRAAPVGPAEVDALLRRAERFRVLSGRRRVVPVLLSRSGFTPAARARLEAGEALGWGLEDLAAIHGAREPLPRRGAGRKG